jgi:Fe-S cluster biosynthesis and repair protein YggX
MPRNDIAHALKEMGAPLPESKVEALTAEDTASGKLKCSRCGRIAPKMPEPPFSGDLGQVIHNSVCRPCFSEWIGQGTKVINELRLNLTEKSAQDVYDQHMRDFLNLPAASVA